jgi:hypothetical protein
MTMVNSRRNRVAVRILNTLARALLSRGYRDVLTALITAGPDRIPCDRTEPPRDLTSTDLGWWAISGASLLDALHRTHAGEDPDLVYTELYANSDHGTAPGEADQ